MNILAVTGFKLLTIVQLFFYVLNFCLDTILYSQCTNLCLLCSDVVNYFLGHKYCIFLNWCCNVITCYTNINYVMVKPQFTRPSN